MESKLSTFQQLTTTEKSNKCGAKKNVLLKIDKIAPDSSYIIKKEAAATPEIREATAAAAGKKSFQHGKMHKVFGLIFDTSKMHKEELSYKSDHYNERGIKRN